MNEYVNCICETRAVLSHVGKETCVKSSGNMNSSLEKSDSVVVKNT